MDTLVRRGDHVLMEVEMSLKAFMAQDFTLTGIPDVKKLYRNNTTVYLILRSIEKMMLLELHLHFTLDT